MVDGHYMVLRGDRGRSTDELRTTRSEVLWCCGGVIFAGGHEKMGIVKVPRDGGEQEVTKAPPLFYVMCIFLRIPKIVGDFCVLQSRSRNISME